MAMAMVIKKILYIYIYIYIYIYFKCELLTNLLFNSAY